jgi:septal ring factor EnvC (AmiA/AmiB activator)
MVPYCLREEHESRTTRLEIGAAVAGIVILAACAIADVPRPSRTTPVGRGKEQVQSRQSLAKLAEVQMATQQLQARNNAVEAELVTLTGLLQSVRAELAGLKEGHDSLEAQVTTTATKLQKLETTVQETSERVANSVDPKVLLQVTKERDEALTQSKQSDDQVRQLTLRLQRAGLFP